MNREESLKKTQEEFAKMIEPMVEDSDPMEITYGLCEGVMQWFCIMCDYPYFTTIPMGQSYEEALAWVIEQMEEYTADQEEEGEDDE